MTRRPHDHTPSRPRRDLSLDSEHRVDDGRVWELYRAGGSLLAFWAAASAVVTASLSLVGAASPWLLVAAPFLLTLAWWSHSVLGRTGVYLDAHQLVVVYFRTQVVNLAEVEYVELRNTSGGLGQQMFVGTRGGEEQSSAALTTQGAFYALRPEALERLAAKIRLASGLVSAGSGEGEAGAPSSEISGTTSRWLGRTVVLAAVLVAVVSTSAAPSATVALGALALQAALVFMLVKLLWRS